MNEPYVHKIFTGKAKTIGDPDAAKKIDREWTTAIYKKETDGPIWLSKTGLAQDEVGDKKNHGGPEKALFTYPVKHYTYWQEKLGEDNITIGGMGENLAVLEMDEYSVCLGDTYQFGDAVIQVSQPRRPCWRPARRYRTMDLALQIQQTGRTGWYFRVLQEGMVKPAVDLLLLERPMPHLTIAALNEIMYVRKEDLNMAYELSDCELLAENWRKTFKKRLRGKESDTAKRIFGPNK
ncbi:MOSC domain-containing protein [Virgibacillus sp. 179-BFC.A HS]|uniref:MOSC domain-containing protein n=1 Tax=Tigheibacillus jepli TaxID=3035914 RepID=A0ABU5CJV6_9BACI|nr:MOSC domain-containing protein [Virgibacillus sp. 179-BFC.A HS]MDY0406623.1 MOSC domain-containing protein [Virgibacillus sp. 179-BFC.A HS]